MKHNVNPLVEITGGSTNVVFGEGGLEFQYDEVSIGSCACVIGTCAPKRVTLGPHWSQGKEGVCLGACEAIGACAPQKITGVDPAHTATIAETTRQIGSSSKRYETRGSSHSAQGWRVDLQRKKKPPTDSFPPNLRLNPRRQMQPVCRPIRPSNPFLVQRFLQGGLRAEGTTMTTW